MGLVARISMLLNSRVYHVTQVNIELCFPEKTIDQQKKLAKESLLHTFKIAPEIAKAWLNPCIKDWISQVYGEDKLKKDIEDGHGILITGSHIGNWEVALFYLGKTFDFTCMYRKPRYQELDDIICKGRCKNTTVMVPGDSKGLREFLKVLKKCKVAALLSDQEPGGDTGVFAPFFGKNAKTMDMIQKIQNRSNAKLYQIAAIRKPCGKYDIFLPSVDIDPDLNELDYATELNKQLEKMIRDYPEQYQWSYKRFKTTEDGSKNPYTK